MLGAHSIYTINSRDRTGGTDTDFTFSIPNFKTENNYDRVVLLGCSIPKSWYLIDSRHNTFTVDEGSGPVVITIPVGNYSFGSLRNTLTTLMTAALSFTYSITANTSTGKYELSVTGNGGVQPVLDIQDFVLGKVLGFPVSSSPYTFSGDSLVGTDVVNFQLTNNVIISSSYVAGIENKGELQSVYSSGENFSSIIFEQKTPNHNAKKLINSTSNVCQFSIFDPENGELLQLNGHNVLLTICMYRHNTFFEKSLAQMTIESALRQVEEI